MLSDEERIRQELITAESSGKESWRIRTQYITYSRI